jgi:Ca-activated chloride channel homolog
MPSNPGNRAPTHPPRRRRPACALAAVALTLAAALAACDGSPTPAPQDQNFTGPPYTLRTLASSELADLRPVLADAAKATGVTLALTSTTSLTGSNTVATGKADGRYDATWFATNRYLTMAQGALAKLGGSDETMSSPVVLGVRASVAHQLGWDREPVSWADIATAAAAHRFEFGMSDPQSTNSGLSALVAIATAVAGGGAALQPAGVTRASPQLREFFSGQSMKAASPEVLEQDYVRAQGGDAQGARVDGLVDYESALLSLNASGKLREPLTLVYPTDGVVTADYTLSVLASASPAARSAYTRLIGYLRTPDVQRRIMQQTRRRPAIPQVRPDTGFGRRQMFELPFPGTLNVVNDLIAAYYGTLRRPARTVYVLDTSGSMAGARLDGLKAALDQLTSTTGNGATFQTREQVTLESFSTTPHPPATFDVPTLDPQPVLNQIKAFTAHLSAAGNTAIYDSLAVAYQIVAQQAAADPDRITTIVLLTDGENNTGRDLTAFTRFYRGLSPTIASVPVFPILFGEADTDQMRQLAALTGGEAFDGRNLALTTIFPLIRGSQ